MKCCEYLLYAVLKTQIQAQNCRIQWNVGTLWTSSSKLLLCLLQYCFCSIFPSPYPKSHPIQNPIPQNSRPPVKYPPQKSPPVKPQDFPSDKSPAAINCRAEVAAQIKETLKHFPSLSHLSKHLKGRSKLWFGVCVCALHIFLQKHVGPQKH